MGTFGGHVLPGSFFIGFGFWTLIHLLKDYFSKPKFCFKSKFAYSISLKEKKKIPIDSAFKILASAIGLTGEIITGFVQEHFVHIGNAQHSTMYSVFLLTGIVELLAFYQILNLPDRIEYTFNLMSFLVEGFLFLFHLHGRSEFDVYLHKVLVCLIWLNVTFGVLEMIYQFEVVYQVARCFFLVLQGTWFCQIGAMLYPPFSWFPLYKQHQDNLNILRAVQILSWHFSVNSILFLTLILLISLSKEPSRLNSLQDFNYDEDFSGNLENQKLLDHNHDVALKNL